MKTLSTREHGLIELAHYDQNHPIEHIGALVLDCQTSGAPMSVEAVEERLQRNGVLNEFTRVTLDAPLARDPFWEPLPIGTTLVIPRRWTRRKEGGIVEPPLR